MITQGLQLSQKQTLKLNAQMLQSLELMTLPLAELEARIDTALLENPTLNAEVRDPRSVSYEDYSERQLKRESRSENYSDSSSYGSDTGAADSYQSWFENTLSREDSLQEHLLWQLGCSEVDEEVSRTAAAIISNLDDEGFFASPLEEVLSPKEMEKKDEALRLLHSFDPAGIACTGWRESLVLQAERAGLEGEDLAVFARLVEGQLESIKSGKDAQAAKALGIDEEDLAFYLDFMKALTPHPASAFARGDERYIVPDVSIKVEDGHLAVRLNNEALPLLSIDSGYQEMEKELSGSKRKEDREAFKYLKGQMQSARELMRQLEMRNSTLEKVSAVLAVRQKAFFLFGPPSLKPLTLKDVAAEIGMSEATVSRITTSKYVDTDWGIIPMKSLFSSAVKTAGGKEDLSKEAVKGMVRKIIEENDTGKPLSDQKISDMLKAKGISCARRTVAKYRGELAIDSSFERTR